MAQSTVQLDTRIDIPTPENIEFAYRLAGPFRRLPAFLMDWLIRLVGAIIIQLLLLMVAPNGIGVGMFLVVFFVVEWFYGALFETYMNGQTPGKRLMGIRVLTTKGRPINGLQAVMRNILRFVDMMPLISLEILGRMPFTNEAIPAYLIPTYIVGLVTMAVTGRFQRLGDVVCGTMVVVEERQWLTGVAKIEDPRAFELASYLPTDFEVPRTLARALSHYVERRRFFSPVRRREVSEHLALPLLRQFGFPLDTNYDLLLCALYYRTFIADRSQDEQRAADARAASQGPMGQAANSAQNPFVIPR